MAQYPIMSGTGWRLVSTIAIDDDVWSALHFRPVGDVKTKRSLNEIFPLLSPPQRVATESGMSTHSTLDRETFQHLLAAAFAVQESQIVLDWHDLAGWVD